MIEPICIQVFVELNEKIFEILIQAKLCVDENVPVIPIPGPSALVTALSASGLSTDEFTFGNLLMKFGLLLMKSIVYGLLTLLSNDIYIFMQLDSFLNMLGQEERGWQFLQLKQLPRYSLFLLTNSVNFLKRLLHFLVTLGNSF